MAENYDGSLVFKTKLDNSEFKKGVNELRKEAAKAQEQVEKAGKGSQSALNIDTGKSQKAMNELGKSAQSAVSDIAKATKAMDEYMAVLTKFDTAAKRMRTPGNTPALDKDNLIAMRSAIAEYGKMKAPKGENGDRAAQILETMETQYKAFQEQADQKVKEVEAVSKLTQEMNARFAEKLQEIKEGDAANNRRVVEESVNLFHELLNRAPDVNNEQLNMMASSAFDALSQRVPELYEKQQKAAADSLKGANAPEIKVRTDVDQEGFNKGSTRLQAAMESLKQRAVSVGDEIKNAIGAAFVSNAPTIRNVSQLTDMLKEMGSTVGRAYDANNIVEFGKAIGDLEAQMNSFAKTKFASGGQVFDGADIENDFTEVQNIVREGQERLKEEFDKLDPSEKLNAETELTQQAIQRFGETVQSIQNVTTPQDAFAIVENLKDQMASYEASPFAKLDVAQDMSRIIDEVTETLTEVQEKWDETHFDTSPFEQGFQDMVVGIKQVPTFTDMIVSGVSRASNAVAGLGGKMAGLGYSIYQGLHDPLAAANRILGMLAAAAGRAARGLLTLGKYAAGTVVGAIRSLAGTAQNAATNLAKMASGAILSGMKKLGSAIFGVGKSTNQMNSGMKINFSTILRYGFGIRSLYFLFNRLRRAMLDGFTQMATGNATLKSNINSLKTALTNLKLSFASAFTPIANIVLPYVTALVNALANAINYVGMFISALTGKTTYTKAAANMDTVASAADHAADSAKEAKRQLAGFDKLEILSANNGGGGSGGGGGNGGGPSFEEAAIDSGIADWAQKLKDMFAAGDYEGIGKVIADGINTAFAKIDELIKWDNVGGVITKYVDAFCRIFNSMVDNIDWDLIGRTFGDGVNTILHTINLLLTGINWDNLGKKFSEGLNGFVNAIEWDLLGETIANYFGAKMDFMSSAIENFNWGKLGTNLAKGINSFVSTISSHLDKIDWNKIGHKLAEGVNNLTKDVDTENVGNTIGKNLTRALNGLSTFLEDVNWQEIGHKAYSLVAGINWSELTSAIYRGMGAAFGAVAGVIWGFIKDGLSNIKQYFDNSIDEAGGNVALGILNGINNGFNNIVSWVKDNILKPFIDGFKKAFSIGSPAKDPDLVDAAGWVGEGILKAIAEKFLDIGGWVKTNILDKIVGALKKGKDKVGEALDFLGNGSKTVKKTVKITISKIANKAGDAWEFIKSGKETIEKKVESIFEKVGNWKDEAWQAVKDGKQTVKKTVQTILEKVGNWKDEAWQAVKEGTKTFTKTVRAVLLEVGKWAGDVWESVKEGTKTFTKTIQIGLSIIDKFTGDVWDAVKSGKETIVKTLSATKDKTFDTVKTGWDSIKSRSARLTAGALNTTPNVLNTLKDAWQTIKNKASTLTGITKNNNPGVISTLKDAWKAIKDKTATLVAKAQNKSAGVVSVIRNTWNNLKDKAVTLRAKAINYNSSVLSKLKDAWQTIKDKTVTLKAKLSGLSDSILRMLGLKKARGGVYANGKWSNIPQYAKGGVVSARKYAGNIPQYAAGGSPHGTMFVAGERGPEIVGHVGGRTEVLNKSQLASTMYSAVVNGMGNIGGRIGEAICNKIAESSNAQVGALHAISSQITYSVPLMATGTVVPYSITKADLMELGHTIEASNDDLQYALVQAIAQAANLIVAAVQDIDTTTTIDQNMITKRTIEDINRRTLMFQASPLK